MMTSPLGDFEELSTRGFAVQLFDGFTGQSQLEGQLTVRIAGRKPPLQKMDSATFVFLELGPGTYSISVESSGATPFYVPVTIPVTLPTGDPHWPMFPDPSLADKSKALDDTSQPQVYRTQRALATLIPTAYYPFPPGATVLRGTVLAGNVPLAGATVVRDGEASGATSDANGEFVLFFNDMSGKGQDATIHASSQGRPNAAATVSLQRGSSVSTTIKMAP